MASYINDALYCFFMISKERLTRSKGTIQYLLEAKISSYKLYDNSLVSLIPKHGWLSDEVRFTLATII